MDFVTVLSSIFALTGVLMLALAGQRVARGRSPGVRHTGGIFTFIGLGILVGFLPV